jgi:ATP-dependent helicase/nuclease subunit A
LVERGMSHTNQPAVHEAAYEINGQRVAAQDFYAAACDPALPVVVEACAGAGKTWMLVSRMLRALLEQGEPLRPDEILAITFTKDAAAQMRERLMQWLAAPDEATLQTLSQPGVLNKNGHWPAQNLREQLSNLYQRLLACGRDVQIKTFHGWFASLLQVAPIAVLQQLGLPPNYELIEDDEPAVALVWRRFYASLLRNAALKTDYQNTVAEHGASNTLKALRAAIAKRVEFLRADAAGAVQGAVKSFQAVVPQLSHAQEPLQFLHTAHAAQSWRAWAKALGSEANKTPQKAAALIIHAFEQEDLQARFELLRAALFIKEEDRLTKNLQKFEAAQQAAVVLLPICQAVAQHRAWQHQQRMMRLVRQLLQDYAAVKQARNWVDMSDLEQAAQVLLSDAAVSGWVQERLDTQVRHLLIDEFQDTNPLQWQALFAWLQSYAGAGRALGVFVVGDPKQSIYRFRRAEPQVFEAAKNFVREQLGGDVLACDHTRRNAQTVISTVNAVMQAAQDADELGRAADGSAVFRAHTTASTVHGACGLLPQVLRVDKSSNQAALTWRDSLRTPRDIAEEKMPTLEAAQAADWIAQALTKLQCKPGEVMVLARKRNRLVELHSALRARGLASYYAEKQSLFDAPEVQDVVALVDALTSPTHDLSWAQALKSPLFNASDEDLSHIALLCKKTRSHWFEVLSNSELLAQINCGPVTDLAQKIKRYQQWLAQVPVHDALDAMYHDAQVFERFAAAAPAALRASVLANLRALLASSLSLDSGRYLSSYRWVRALKAGQVKALPTVQTDAVQLLTVHGAKGLEAPVVMLLDTDAQAEKAEYMSALIDWPAHANAPQRFVFLQSESKVPVCCADLLAHERAARARESLNNLYVAMTRAKQQLVVSSHEPHHGDDASAWKRFTLAASLGQGGIERIAAPPAAQHAGDGDVVSSSFLIKKLPLAGIEYARAAINAVATISTNDSSDSARIGQAMHRLLERASRAEVQAKTFSSASVQNAARYFQLSHTQASQAARMAQQILCGDAAWVWDDAVIDWAGNEVELLHQGELLRIDRLVRRKGSGDWWVLDYKSAQRPQHDEALLAQLRRYQQAVQHANASHLVHAAFLTANGQLVEI